MTEPLDPPVSPAPPAAPVEVEDPGDASLLALIDRLATMLDRTELTELEVQVGGTGLILRKPAAVVPVMSIAPGAVASAATTGVEAGPTDGSTPREAPVAAKPSVEVRKASREARSLTRLKAAMSQNAVEPPLPSTTS